MDSEQLSNLQEVYNLFDTDSEGLKPKDLGTLMRSLGFNVSQHLLDAMIAECLARTAKKVADGTSGHLTPGHIDYNDFRTVCVERAASDQKDALAGTTQANADLNGLRNGLNHFHIFASGKRGTDSKSRFRTLPPSVSKPNFSDAESAPILISDLVKALQSVGDRLTEEEVEDFVKDIKANCVVKDGKVKFGDLRQWVV